MSEVMERRVEDLGTVGAAVPRLKAMLARRIARILEDRKLTMRAAESATGFAASDFSQIRGGMTDRFTIDRLLAILARLDPTAEISASVRSRLTCAAAVGHLKAHEADARKLGVTALYLFGSTVRDEAGPNSDLDVFLEHGPEFDLLDLIGIKQALEDDLGIEAHVTTRESLHPDMRGEIEREAIRVF